MRPQNRGLLALKRHRSGLIGLGIVIILALVALGADFIAPGDPVLQNSDKMLIPPIWDMKGQWPHVLGTDLLGRDLLTRIIYGARLSLMIGVMSVFVGAALGVPLGMISGYVGGRTDLFIMRIIDLLLAFPSALLAVCIVAALGPSLENAMLAIGILGIPTYARVVRASVLSEKEREYVLADKALGRGHIPTLFLGIFPNIIGPLLVITSLNFASAVLETAGLSFLGLGAQPPIPEWGALLAEGKAQIYEAWWLIFFPGMAILLAVIGFNLLGDALRDIYTPSTK